MIKYFVLILGLMLLTYAAYTQNKKSIDPVYSTKAGAISGYDPIAYFTEHKPVKGKSDISLEWNGATWHFATVENRSLFVQDPEKYAPVYGGYCAYGWAQGYDAPTEPDAWSIVDGKLYLNYNLKVQALWNKKQPEYIKTADTNWQNAKKN